MVPAGYVQGTVDQLADLLDADDVVIDGGNSYTSTNPACRAAGHQGHPLRRLGTSGGVWGLERGYCQMIGGEDAPCSGSIRSSQRSPPERESAGDSRT